MLDVLFFIDQNKERGLKNDKDIHDQDVSLLAKCDGGSSNVICIPFST